MSATEALLLSVQPSAADRCLRAHASIPLLRFGLLVEQFVSAEHLVVLAEQAGFTTS